MKTLLTKVLSIVCFLIIVFLAMFYSFPLLPNPVMAIENFSSVDQGDYDEYTDFNSQNCIKVKEFINHYSQGINLYNGRDLGEDYEAMYVYAEVEKDNPIVDFVPKELF